MKSLRVLLTAASILALAWPAGAEPRLPAEQIFRMPARGQGRRLTPATLAQLIRQSVGEDPEDDRAEAKDADDPFLASKNSREAPGWAKIVQRIMAILTEDGRRRGGRLWGAARPAQAPKRAKHLMAVVEIVVEGSSAPSSPLREGRIPEK